LTDAARGLEIVRVLLAVVDSPSTDLHEDWMAAVRITTSMKPPSKTSPSIVLELQIAMVQLSTALLSKAAGGMQKRHVTSIAALSGLAQQLMKIVRVMSNKLDGEEYVTALLTYFYRSPSRSYIYANDILDLLVYLRMWNWIWKTSGGSDRKVEQYVTIAPVKKFEGIKLCYKNLVYKFLEDTPRGFIQL